VFDQYSDTDSFPVMSDDQKKKLTTSGGYGKDYLFLFSWTLTGKSGLLDIQVLSALARPWLPQVLTDIQNKKLNPPNIVYYDFVDPYINRAIIDLN
jgi:1-phosphatidylinositol phosphodiesterase